MAVTKFVFDSLGGALSALGNQIFRAAVLAGLPITVFITVFKTYVAITLVNLLEPIGDAVDALVLQTDINSLNVNLSKVNAVFPIPEFLTMVGGFLAVWGAVQAVKWLLKFIPTMG